MEEKQEKKQPEFKGKMLIVWLTGILVIILGCVTVYTFKLVNENKKSKQVPQAQQPQVIEQEQKTEEAATNATEDKNAVEVIGLSTKFKELSTISIENKKIDIEENDSKFSYDFNKNGKNEEILISKNLNKETISLKYDNKIIASFVANEEFIEDTLNPYYFYIVDFDENDDYNDLVVVNINGTSSNYMYYCFKNDGKTLKLINSDNNYMYGKTNKQLYLDGEGKIFLLGDIESKFKEIISPYYYEIKENKLIKKEINLENKKVTIQDATDLVFIKTNGRKTEDVEINSEYTILKTYSKSNKIKVKNPNNIEGFLLNKSDFQSQEDIINSAKE